jgi:hypothetical protein
VSSLVCGDVSRLNFDIAGNGFVAALLQKTAILAVFFFAYQFLDDSGVISKLVWTFQVMSA